MWFIKKTKKRVIKSREINKLCIDMKIISMFYPVI